MYLSFILVGKQWNKILELMLNPMKIIARKMFLNYIFPIWWHMKCMNANILSLYGGSLRHHWYLPIHLIKNMLLISTSLLYIPCFINSALKADKYVIFCMFKRFYTLLNIVFVQAFLHFHTYLMSQSYFVKIKISLKKSHIH